MLQIDSRQIGRLTEIVKNLEDRLAEAEIHGWGGEIEGLVHLRTRMDQREVHLPVDHPRGRKRALAAMLTRC